MARLGRSNGFLWGEKVVHGVPMRALRRWVRKARCRAKYGKACPHGGHYGGKRRNSVSSVQPQTLLPKDHGGAAAHRARKRSTDDANADA